MVRALSLLLGLTLLTPTLLAQSVSIILFQPPPNQLRVADLWRVNLVNNSRESVEIYLRGTVTEARDGLVVDATSRIFTLPPGASQFTGRELEPIKVNSSNDRYQTILTRTGTAPSGEYTICVFAIEAATGAEIGDNCISHTVERFSPPILISPTDEAGMSEKLPVFTWTPPVPTPNSRTGLTYRLRIAEVLGRQTPYDALQSNPPFFERRDIRTPVLQYPPTARSFVQGRRYAWGVSAFDGKIEIGESEVWSFTARSVEGLLATDLQLDEKLVATLLTMKGDGAVAGRGNSATLVESSDGSSKGRFGAIGTLTSGGGSATMDAQIWTWGNNEYGQLATGGVPATARSTPKAVPQLDHIRSVALGAEHGLAIELSGNVGAWGNNDFGQLGIGNDEAKNQPVWIPGLTGVIDIGAGNYHSIALKNDGTVWTWGYNRSGELGRGSDPDDDSPGKVSLTGIIAVAAGDGHSLALKSDGTVWGWGTNRYGQADPSSDADPIVTRPVKVEGLSGVKAIAAGGGFSLALLEDGTVRSWGSNNSGQLGNGESEPGATLINRFVLGEKVLRGTDGAEKKIDRFMVRGTGSGETPSVGGISLVKGIELGIVIVNFTGVSRVSGLTGVVAIDAGGSHALALRSDSTAWSWGNNYWGTLGVGDRDGRPGPARINSLDRVIDVAAGGDHSLAVTADRSLYAWGNNRSKQLGRASLPAGDESDLEESTADPVVVPKP